MIYLKSVPKNAVFIIGGIALLLIAEFMISGEDMELPKILLAFVGFAIFLDGAFGFYKFYKK